VGQRGGEKTKRTVGKCGHHPKNRDDPKERGGGELGYLLVEGEHCYVKAGPTAPDSMTVPKKRMGVGKPTIAKVFLPTHWRGGGVNEKRKEH